MIKTASSQEISRAITAHALGVKSEPQPAGIFNDFHQITIERLRSDIEIMRGLWREDYAEMIELPAGPQAWRLTAAVAVGFLVMVLILGGKR